MRRVLGVLVGLTLLLVLADIAGGPTGPIRSAGTAVFGPLVGATSPGADDREAELVRLRQRVAELEDARQAAEGDAAVRSLADRHELEVRTGRVVAVGPADARGPVRVTIDIGRSEGVEEDRAVINADGLVGRVVAVGRSTSDVELLGASGTRLGVRVGEDPGVLGELTASLPTLRERPGEVAVSAIQQGRLRPDDAVTTLGSPGAVPYPPGLPVGTVVAAPTVPGQLTGAATVRPAADLATLDVVGVVLPKGAR